MAKPSDRDKPAKPADVRAQRLKAALKANLARRKAQARARSGHDDGEATGLGQGSKTNG